LVESRGMEAVKQYEIWWATLSAPAGRRPVLLLSRDGAYEYLNKFAVVEITTHIRNIAVEVLLGRAEGMPNRCVANFDNLRTVPRNSLQRRAGTVAPKRHVEIKRALGRALAWEELVDAE
jgi:mRNA-degrading endonuclease toxin of MazEF toxin-antitoxin module